MAAGKNYLRVLYEYLDPIGINYDKLENSILYCVAVMLLQIYGSFMVNNENLHST